MEYTNDLRHLASAVVRVQLRTRDGDIQAKEALDRLRDTGDPSLLSSVLVQQANSSSPDIDLWHELAAIALRRADFAEAWAWLERILRVKPGDSEAMNEIARLAAIQGDLKNARKLYEQLMDHVQGVGIWAAAAINGLGLVSEEEGDNSAAQRHLEEASRRFKELGDLRGQGGALVNLGILAARQGQLHDARNLFDEARACFETANDPAGIAAALSGAGAALLQVNREEDRGFAIEVLGRALTIHEQIADVEGVISDLSNLALLAIYQGRYEEALMLLDRSESLSQKSDNLRGQATVLAHRAELFKQRGQRSEAIAAWRKALALLERIGDPRSIAICSFNLGMELYVEHDYNAAADAFHTAAERFHRIGDAENERRSRTNEANARMNL